MKTGWILEEKCRVSIVLLTYNRPKYITDQLASLTGIENTEIIIVDNCSEEPYAEKLSDKYSNVSVITLDKNYGAVGRNHGISAAKGEVIITLDDDVWGIDTQDILKLIEIFNSDQSIACVCFHVVDEKSNTTTNWIHHCDKDKYSKIMFQTYEISEGAAAFRRNCFDKVGLYPEPFFISHEGPDLAFRILNTGWKIIYTPFISVVHAHAKEGRPNWRRYYFDTRNLIWLAYRNYNMRLMISRLPIQLAAMLIYSIRDGYIRYFFKAIYDGLTGLKQFNGTRNAVSEAAYTKIREIDKNRPSILFYVKERLFKRNIRI